jgi:hypothetical protein
VYLEFRGVCDAAVDAEVVYCADTMGCWMAIAIEEMRNTWKY